MRNILDINTAKFEEGQVGQTSTPRTLVFFGRHILDVLMGENTCAMDSAK